MRRFKDDERVLAWALYNEPGGSAGEKSVTLLLDAWKWAREVNPLQPVCSTAEGSSKKISIDIARANSDVISFHCYNDKSLPGSINSKAGQGISSNRQRVVSALFADGHVESIPEDLSPETLKALLTRAGNDSPGPDWPECGGPASCD
jgi:prepilin-type processing-associated H-X9-DG protein